VKNFGKIVQHYRLNRPDPLTLEEVDNKCGVTKTAIMNIENSAMPRLDLAVRLIKALGIPPSMIFKTNLSRNEVDGIVKQSQFL